MEALVEEVTVEHFKFNFWEMFLITLFDIDVNDVKYYLKSDLESLELRNFIPKYSFLEMIKMFLYLDSYPDMKDKNNVR